MESKRSYIFVLGRNDELSVAEIKSVFAAKKWSYEEVLKTWEILIVDSVGVDLDYLHKTLGGTVKIGEVVSVSPLDSIEERLDFNLLDKMLAVHTGKVQFGISVYDGGVKQDTEYLDRNLSLLCKSIKRTLRSNDISVRFAFNTDRYLSSVVVTKDKLITKGCEILLIPMSSGVVIGKTLSVQEFEAFSHRDYGRPVRDMKSGVMPPKLARMMINISEAPKDKVLLDPFCGSGTMLQEAVLLGYQRVLGRDVSKKAVFDTKENLDWLFNATDTTNNKPDVAQADVKNLSRELKTTVHAIVTEPYLGPTLHDQSNRNDAAKTTNELRDLYINAFREFHKILDKNGVIVFILPAFRVSGRAQYMNIIRDIEGLGFRQSALSMTDRKSIVIGNKYDFVLREIVKFVKE